MKFFLQKIFKPFLIAMLSFYAIILLFIVCFPAQKETLTLISITTTICTLVLCVLFSIIVFEKKNWIFSSFRCLVFIFMTVTYSVYLANEFRIVSLVFNYISFSFDLLTSCLSFLSIIEYFKGKNDAN